MRIVILGSTGMLGHALVQHLETSYFEVLPVNREMFDASCDPISKIPSCDWLVNCIGAIKQNSPSLEELKKVNAEFPRRLAESLRHTKVIHVSTDCVFSGKKGNYVESDIPDPADDYGVSKFEGEPIDDAMVIRTSLIGREIRGKKSLLEWCLSQAGKEVQGFSNHKWNGLTTLEFSKCIKKIIDEELYKHGVHHVFSTPVSKYDILQAVNKKFELGIKIRKTKAEALIDRTLNTEKELNSALQVLSFDQMMKEIK